MAKLAKYQIDALVRKLSAEINDPIKKHNDQVRTVTDKMYQKEVRKDPRFKALCSIVGEDGFDEETFTFNNYYANEMFNSFINKHFTKSDVSDQLKSKVSESEIENEIILATIDGTTVDEIIKIVKNKLS